VSQACAASAVCGCLQDPNAVTSCAASTQVAEHGGEAD